MVVVNLDAESLANLTEVLELESFGEGLGKFGKIFVVFVEDDEIVDVHAHDDVAAVDRLLEDAAIGTERLEPLLDSRNSLRVLFQI